MPVPEPSSPAPTIEPKQLTRLLAGMRARNTALEMSANASATPPQGVGSMDGFRSIWGIQAQGGVPAKKAVFARCRQLYATNDTVGWHTDALVALCNDGFSVCPEKDDGTEDEEMKKWIRESGFDFAKVARDTFIERILCDNAVLFWKDHNGEEMPFVQVMDSENCEWSNGFGINLLKVTMPSRNLSQEEREMLGPRYVDAYSGKALTIKDDQHGEHFRVISGEKNGNGLRLPSLYQVFTDLSLRDLLRMGDWNAAWMLRNIIRHVKRGHEVKQGTLAGQDIHFLKGKEAKKIKTGLATNTGTFDMVTNFDVTIGYSHLDAKYLDTAKYNGVNARLRDWLGPLGKIREEKQVDPDTMKALQIQCEALRGEACKVLEQIFNHPSFIGNEKPPQPIKVTWSPNTFVSTKVIIERVRLAQSSGISSTRTAREDLGYSHTRESARIKAEHSDAKAITPAFEQKQGMAGNASKNGGTGGRPPTPEPSPAT